MILPKNQNERMIIMKLQDNNTEHTKELQEVHQKWEKKIAAHLPKQLEELLKQSNTIQRKRGIKNGKDFLKLFFLFASSRLSFRMLALCANVLSITAISDSALRKQFKKSIPFLRNILDTLLTSLQGKEVGTPCTRNVYLVDASTIRQDGKEQTQERIHLCYDLNQNRMNQAKVTDVHTAEGFSNYTLEAGAIYLADAGYGTAKNYEIMQKAKADVIVRITPHLFNLYTIEHEKINLISYLTLQKEKGITTSSELKGYCFFNGKAYFVRLVVIPLPPEEAGKARKRKQKIAQRKGHKIKKETLLSAGFVLLATSLGAEYDREEIAFLYQSRWQVELLFKRFKQNFKIQTIRQASEAYALALIYLWLILWCLLEKELILVERFWKEKNETQELTLSSITLFLHRNLVNIIELSWVSFVDFSNIKLLNACLSSRSGKRLNKNKVFQYNTLSSLIS